jgi:hypothetical protein
MALNERPRFDFAGLYQAASRLSSVANLQKRGDYTPRKQREQQAYRLGVVGATTGGLGVVALVLAVVGVVGAFPPIILLGASGVSFWRLRRILSGR